MAFQNVHIPLQVPKRYSDKYSFIDDEDRRTYAGMVDILDEAVGNITQAMKDAGYDNCFACRVIYAAVPVFSQSKWKNKKKLSNMPYRIDPFTPRNSQIENYKYGNEKI